MTEVPDYARSPFAPQVHTGWPKDSPFTGLSEDERRALRYKLIESITQVIVQAITGLFIPGGATAFAQLQDWAEDVFGKFLGAANIFGLISSDDLLGPLDLEAIWADIITGQINPLGLIDAIDAIARDLTHDLMDQLAGVVGATPTDIDNWLLGLLTGDWLSDTSTGFQGLLNALKGGSGGVIADVVDRLQHLTSGTGLFDSAQLTNITNIPAIAQAKITGLASDLSQLFGFNTLSVKRGSNLAADGGIERTDLNYVGCSTSTEQAHSGSRSLKLISTATYWAANSYAYPVCDQAGLVATPMRQDDRFYVECWIRGHSSNTQTTPAAGFEFGCDFYDSSNSFVGGTNAVTQLTTTALNGVWTKVSGYMTAGSPGTHHGHIFIRLGDDCDSGEIYYVDDIIIREETAAQNVIDGIWQAATHLTDTGKLIADAIDALRAIPTINVLGFGGPADIGESLQTTWDRAVSGLVGVFGTGSSLADLFDINQLVSSRATKGEWSWDTLSIRDNKSINSGLLATSESNFPLSVIFLGYSSAPDISVTQSATSMNFIRVKESVNKKIVGWYGWYTGSITDFRIVIWQMNKVTGDLDSVVHTSTNQVGLLSTSSSPPPHVVYELPTGIDVVAGDIYGVEFCVVGSGTLHLAGFHSWPPNSTVAIPRRFSASRTSGTTTFPPSAPIADGGVPYAGDTAWFEFGKEGATTTTSAIPPHSPTATLFTASGTYSIPSWCTIIDVIAVGAGGGGEACGLVWGQGGRAGSWNSTALTRGTHISSGATTMSVTVGAGGAGGSGFGANGSSGGASSVSATGMTTLTASGGAGGSASNADITGQGPGNRTHNGIVYAGGAAASVPFSNGHRPGGGGAGGTVIGVNAGTGGGGSVWIVARQS